MTIEARQVESKVWKALVRFVIIKRNWPAELGRTPSQVEKIKFAPWKGSDPLDNGPRTRNV